LFFFFTALLLCPLALVFHRITFQMSRGGFLLFVAALRLCVVALLFLHMK
jgi:hypothetical protein